MSANLLIEPPKIDTLPIDTFPFAKNSIYIEFLGTGPMLSINYDRSLLDKPKWNLTGRIGTIGWNENFIDNSWDKTRTLVLGLTLLLNEKNVRNKYKNFTELGAGHSSVWHVDTNEDHRQRSKLIKSGYSMFYTLNFGIRRQPIKRGITLRAVFTILILTKPVDIVWDTYRISILPWAGLSIGYSF